jgi:hypothetical protein
MPNSNEPKSSNHTFIRSAEDWLAMQFTNSETERLMGTADNPIVRPQTKNLIEAPDKSFKTTFTMRTALSLATGFTVFRSLPVNGTHRTLYLHGEIAPAELQERLRQAVRDIPRPVQEFFQGRSISASLVSDEGKNEIRRIVAEYTPKVLVLDPWQSFIAGADENNFKEISRATSFLDDLSTEFNLTLFIPVHMGKNVKRGARGTSLLAGWRDTKFQLKRGEANNLTVTIDPRWAKPPERLELTFKLGTLWEGTAPRWTGQQVKIQELLQKRGGRMLREDLGAALGLEDSGLRTALKRARDAGIIMDDEDEDDYLTLC